MDHLEQAVEPNAIVMDNGRVFYLHVIGLTRLRNQPEKSLKQ